MYSQSAAINSFIVGLVVYAALAKMGIEPKVAAAACPSNTP